MSGQNGEKEFGTYGPAVCANTFFTNPVYYEDGIDEVPTKEYSRYVSDLMDRLGYSYGMIKYRQQMYIEYDNLSNRKFRHYALPVTAVTTGGQAEGSVLFFESDEDHMLVMNDVICADNPHFFHHENTTLFQTERHETSPGYTRLKLVRFGGNNDNKLIRSSLFTAETGSNYLSSQIFSNEVKLLSNRFCHSLGMNSDPASGPSSPISNQFTSVDQVYCFRCFCPDILGRWVTRPRPQRWPSTETVREISLLDGHVVPVGFKGSQNMYREWRICFSLAELHLMRNLNETQLKVYILLKKLAKAVLKPVCKDMTSYIMKNVILWVCEVNGLDGFTTELIMDRLFDCIRYLKQCVDEKSLPSYMIHERNLLAGRLTDQQKHQLTSLLRSLLNERGRMFLRCEKLRNAMIVMYKTPDMFRQFGEKRDKIESLQLMGVNVVAECVRTGMTIEDIRHEQWRIELYRNIETHIKLLMQFDEQALMQAGKTNEEIEYLYLSKLAQLLS